MLDFSGFVVELLAVAVVGADIGILRIVTNSKLLNLKENIVLELIIKSVLTVTS